VIIPARLAVGVTLHLQWALAQRADQQIDQAVVQGGHR